MRTRICPVIERDRARPAAVAPSSWALIGFVAGLDEEIICMVPIATLCVYEAGKFIGIELLVALETHRDIIPLALDCALA